MKKRDVYNVDLNDAIGSEQSGFRPAVIVQNDAGNFTSPTLVIVPISHREPSLPSHIPILKEECDIEQDSIALCEQIRVIDKSRLGRRLFTLSWDIMARIEEGIKINLDME